MKQICSEEIKQSLDKFEEDGDWFYKHIADLQKEHEGKLVAVKDKKIISVKKQIGTLLKDIEKKGIDVSNVYINFVPEKNMIYIY
jgi:hypothetical protein